MRRTLALMLVCASLTQAKDELLPQPRAAVIEGNVLPPPRIYAEFDVSEYKYPAGAKTTNIQRRTDNRQSATQAPYLGIQLAGNLRIEQVDSESPAAKSGLKPGDALVGVDNKSVAGIDAFRDAVMLHAPGDQLELKVNRDGKEQKFSIALTPVSTPFLEKESGRKGGSWDNRLGGSFRRNVYRLAVLLIAYSDVPINSKITPQDWDRSLFSNGVYFDKSATGQQVYGSMNDYYQEQSCGQLRVEGKVFQPLTVAKKRLDYTNMPSRTALLSEAVDLLRARDGKEALKDFDGICFIYAGDTASNQRSSLYWPHRASFTHQNNERFSYFIVPEGGARMYNISTICHEFGHMLGLPDLYAKPEVPGMEGLGSWCAMSQQNRGGRPQHFCAWSKEQLGWIKPAIIDPAVPQKLILAPIEGTADQCYKILMKPDASEYLLLEIRTKSGFDKDLQGEGLLIWHVTDNRPLLEESHGIAGPAGPRSFPAAVPYPSKANTSYTPYTTPSSMPYKLGAKPVFITNIRRLPDGKITFQIGYEYL